MSNYEYSTFSISINADEPEEWEDYEEIDEKFLAETLNKAARSGWELVSIIPVVVKGTTVQVVITYKRTVF
ncbi:hypothetical protein ABID42_003037 [Arcicella rosea]|uniref:DUF4177 domain-containing protein n=1 Tax=Arcicella rosea TaxID=502909 RepID=UPI00345CD426